MQVEELYWLTEWIEDQVVEAEVQKKYEALHQALSQNAQGGQQQQPFEEQKNDLITTLDGISLIELSVGQVHILERIGIGSYIGNAGVQYVEDTLYHNALDMASAASRIQEAVKNIASGTEWSKGLRNHVERILEMDDVRERPDEALLRIHFSGEAHLSNVTEFKGWGEAWWEIGRGVAMAHGKSPEDVRVVGASKGSLIVTLSTISAIAMTVSFVLMRVLSLMEKVLDIKRKAQEVRALELSNDQAENALLDEAKKAKEEGANTITEETIEEIEKTRKLDGEEKKVLSKAIVGLMEFVERGGEIDLIPPAEQERAENEESEDDPAKEEARGERAALRDRFAEVRRLEKRVEQLENRSNDEAAAE